MEQNTEELIKFLTKQMGDFFKENPEIFKAMIKGYKAQFWFEETIHNPQMMVIKADVIAPDGRGMTLEEFFKNHGKEK